MRFAVLGQLTVTGDGGSVRVSAAKQRLLLAVLLSRAGTAVSVDTLMEALWSGHPPESSHKRLSWHIHRLRRLFDDPTRVGWSANTYTLTVHAGELDADEFARLRHTGDAAWSRGDASTASAHWTEALRLWQGPAYGDLGDHAALRTDALRLEQSRLRTQEDRIDADLELQKYDQLIVELTALIAEQPLREKIRCRLMLALYRSGHRSEALEVYRDGRNLLIEQLGVEPGPELGDLHKAILRDSRELTVAKPSSLSPRPAELPSAAAAFTGRAEEVKRLCGLLTGGPSARMVVSAITGSGGIGKSSLAVHTGHLVADRFPDGQLYLNLRGATPSVPRLTAADALARLLRSIGVDLPKGVLDTDELAARFRSATSGSRLLLVLDDAADAAQVEPLLPGSATCAVIVTSRDSLSQLDGATFSRLEVLPQSAALELFGKLTQTREPAVSAEIVEQCGRVPLAICITASLFNTNPGETLRTVSDRLRSQPDRLSQLDDGQRAVRSSFMVSYRDLADDSARMFRLLGLHEGTDIGTGAAAALVEASPQRATTLLSSLVEAHLVTEPAPGRFAIHDLLRLFSRERAIADESAPERDLAVDRMLHSYLATARNALRAYSAEVAGRCDLDPIHPQHDGTPVDNQASAQAWATAEVTNLEKIVRQASASGKPSIAAALAVAITPMLYDHGYWHKVHSISQAAVDCAEQSESTYTKMHTYRDLANVEMSLGLLDKALENSRKFQTAASTLGDERLQARAFHLMGTIYRHMRMLDTALEYLEDGLAMCASSGHERLEILIWIQMGMIQKDLHRVDAASEALNRASSLAERLGDSRNRAAAICNLGHLLRDAERAAAAVSAYEKALAILHQTELASSFVAADTLWGLAGARYDLNQITRAKSCWNEAAAILFDLNLISDTEQRVIASSDHPDTPSVFA